MQPWRCLFAFVHVRYMDLKFEGRNSKKIRQNWTTGWENHGKPWFPKDFLMNQDDLFTTWKVMTMNPGPQADAPVIQKGVERLGRDEGCFPMFCSLETNGCVWKMLIWWGKGWESKGFRGRLFSVKPFIWRIGEGKKQIKNNPRPILLARVNWSSILIVSPSQAKYDYVFLCVRATLNLSLQSQFSSATPEWIKSRKKTYWVNWDSYIVPAVNIINFRIRNLYKSSGSIGLSIGVSDHLSSNRTEWP